MKTTIVTVKGKPKFNGDVIVKSGNLYAVQFDNGLIKFGYGITAYSRIYELAQRCFNYMDSNIVKIVTWEAKTPWLAEKKVQEKIAKYHYPHKGWWDFKGMYELYKIPLRTLIKAVDENILDLEQEEKQVEVDLSEDLQTLDDEIREYYNGIKVSKYANYKKLRGKNYFRYDNQRVIFKIAHRPSKKELFTHLEMPLIIKKIFDDIDYYGAEKWGATDVFTIGIDYYSFVGENPFPKHFMRGSKEWHDWSKMLTAFERKIYWYLSACFLRRRDVDRILDINSEWQFSENNAFKFTLRDLFSYLKNDGLILH